MADMAKALGGIASASSNNPLSGTSGYRFRELLTQNKDKDFVNRIINPASAPSPIRNNGEVMTHMMAAETGPDGAWYVFPTVINLQGKLVEVPLDLAMEYALRSGENIRFDKKEDALDFSENYKTPEFLEFYSKSK